MLENEAVANQMFSNAVFPVPDPETISEEALANSTWINQRARWISKQQQQNNIPWKWSSTRTELKLSEKPMSKVNLWNTFRKPGKLLLWLFHQYLLILLEVIKWFILIQEYIKVNFSVRSTVVQQGIRVELLLLFHIERRLLRWCGHLTRIPPGCLRYFGNFLPVGGPNADPGLIGQIISLGWLGNNSVYPWRREEG